MKTHTTQVQVSDLNIGDYVKSRWITGTITCIEDHGKVSSIEYMRRGQFRNINLLNKQQVDRIIQV